MPLHRKGALPSLCGRIFRGKSASAFPENAPRRRLSQFRSRVKKPRMLDQGIAVCHSGDEIGNSAGARRRMIAFVSVTGCSSNFALTPRRPCGQPGWRRLARTPPPAPCGTRRRGTHSSTGDDRSCRWRSWVEPHAGPSESEACTRAPTSPGPSAGVRPKPPYPTPGRTRSR